MHRAACPVFYRLTKLTFSAAGMLQARQCGTIFGRETAVEEIFRSDKGTPLMSNGESADKRSVKAGTRAAALPARLLFQG